MLLKKINLFVLPLVMLCMSAICPAAVAASIEFTVGDIDTSRDFAAIMQPINRMAPLDAARYKPLAASYLLQAFDLSLNSGDDYRVMLVCSEASPLGVLRNIQLLVVDDRKSTPNVLQRIKLGDGEAPQILGPDEAPDFEDIMFRVIRAGNNSESYVYYVNRAAGSLTETLRINRSFPDRMKLSIKGKMQPDGFIEVESKNSDGPLVASVIDMSAAMDSFIEDELYQESGHPLPSQANLICVRNGWEDERIHIKNGDATIEVGLSLITTTTRKQVLDVIVTMGKDEGNRWIVDDVAFEPFLPYRW